MGWGSRALDQDKVREALLTQAVADLAGNLGSANDKTYLAALYLEQLRTNDLLEQLVRLSSPTAP